MANSEVKKEVAIADVQIVKPVVVVKLSVLVTGGMYKNSDNILSVDTTEEAAKKLRDALLNQYPVSLPGPMIMVSDLLGIQPVNHDAYYYARMQQECLMRERRAYEIGFEDAGRRYRGMAPLDRCRCPY